jgi:hypothetical protein
VPSFAIRGGHRDERVPTEAVPACRRLGLKRSYNLVRRSECQVVAGLVAFPVERLRVDRSTIRMPDIVCVPVAHTPAVVDALPPIMVFVVHVE